MNQNRKNAELAEIFVDVVTKRAYNGAIKDALSKLEKESRQKNPPKKLIEMQHWYRNLENNEQSYVKEIIRDSIEASVFGFFVVLDGAYMGDQTNQLTEWVLHHQEYENKDDYLENNPTEATRLTMVKYVEALHDIFLHNVKENH